VGLVDDVGPGTVAIDTALVIYLIEQEPRYLPHTLPLFTQANRGERVLVTSALTLFEVLVVPYRARNLALAERYEALLTHSRGLRLIDLSRDLLRAAAQLRAATSIKVPDALQFPAALATGCRTFVTNNRRLPAIPGLRVIQLSAY
jgi:predicted nucleic acid-binding protein